MGSVKRVKQRDRLFKKQDGKCYWCNRQMNNRRNERGQPFKDTATLDHIRREDDLLKTGGNRLVVACYECNHTRDNKTGRLGCQERESL